ncbi:MAG: S8 family serine peptidase [Phycisphaerales bacterium]|nr:S8 family serine peptidase [Phycisphaerales bacterium]
MVSPTRTRTAMLACSLFLLSGSVAGLASAESAQQPQASGVLSASELAVKMTSIRAALDIDSDDETLIRDALQSPMNYTSVKDQREFTGELIVHAKPGKALSAEARVLPSVVKKSAFVSEYVIEVPAGVDENELAAVLMATGDYEFVEPNYRLFQEVVPNDSQYGSSWQHTRLRSAAAWDIHTGDSDIIVAVCDSGVDSNHPDLEDALIPGYNSVNNLAEVDGGDTEDLNGHGTFVSGCAAAQGNNGRGVVGVGWDFTIMPIRVSNLSSGNANSFDILEGARWAVDNGAKVVNASYSGGTSGANESTAKYIADRGGLLFWSSGNDNSLVSYNGPNLIMVGSTTSSDRRSGFSNFGPAVDVSAPGSSVRSTTRGGGYSNSSGTSYASPIAAGVGAMIFSVRSDISAWDAQDILYQSVDDLGAPGRDDSFGHGRVNTLNAIQVAQSYVPRTLLPVMESCDSASWMDLFSATAGSVSTVVDTESADSGSVLLLEGGDQVTSEKIAGLSLGGNYGLGFGLKTTGVEAGKNLAVELLLEDGSWETVYDYTSTGNDTDGYVDFWIQLPNSFKRHGVELRMSGQGSDSSDQWRIDDLAIENRSAVPVAPLVDSFEGGPISSLIWEENSGVESAVVGSTYAAVFEGIEQIESVEVLLNQFGITPGFVRIDAWADAGAGNDDTLLIEVLDIADNWQTVATLDGSELGTSPESFEFQTPFGAWAIDTTRLRVTSAGDDALYIDNVYYGTEQQTAACNEADFNEDGLLDFFDISAFLTAYGNAEPVADLNNDAVLDFFDVSAFLTAYGAGCP